jgi:hypothetical protein
MSIKSASGLIIGSNKASGFSTRPRGFAYPIGGDPGRLINFVTVIQSFTATGDWTCPTGVTEVEYLVVAGGGGGAGRLVEQAQVAVERED